MGARATLIGAVAFLAAALAGPVMPLWVTSLATIAFDDAALWLRDTLR